MFRVCLTLLAYIISFLSHSNEISGVSDTGVKPMSSDKRSVMLAPDTLAVQERKKNVKWEVRVKTGT